MIWLTWRQHRSAMAWTAGLLAILGVFMVIQGDAVHAFFADNGLKSCLASHGDCSTFIDSFDARFSGLRFVIPLVLMMPLVLGIFWGAPLVARELEQGTHRFVWTQSITRRRWTSTKLFGITLVAVVYAGAFAALSTWFATPFNRSVTSRVSPGVFDLQGVVPVAYAVFAVALGAALGAVVRRTIPAMVATLAGFIGFRVLFEVVVRPNLLSTRTLSYTLFTPSPRANAGDWIVSERVIDGHGHVLSTGSGFLLSPDRLAQLCPSLHLAPGQLPDKSLISACIKDVGIRTVETYHPASQFWTFQILEALVFFAAAVALGGFTLWWVRRRIV